MQTKKRKEIKKMRKETKNGVTYTFEEDGFANEAIDVEVQPGIFCNMVLICLKARNHFQMSNA